jgi:hypothetical protein
MSDYLLYVLIFSPIDGHSVLIAFKLMQTSRFSQSSCHICRQILSEELFPFQVYLRHSHLPLVVSLLLTFFNSPDAKIVSDYVSRLKSINHPLRLLVENEIFRLSVWANPSNDGKRGTDHVGTSERNMSEVSTNPYPDICFANMAFLRVLGRRWFALYGKSILPSRCIWRSDSRVPGFSRRSESWFAQAR